MRRLLGRAGRSSGTRALRASARSCEKAVSTKLPQLLNILRGEMSFIGPRPERPHFVEQLGEAIPSYHERARVKPGLTGWAQVNYPYGASIEDARAKLSYDLYYVKNRFFAFRHPDYTFDCACDPLSGGCALTGSRAHWPSWS